MKTIKQRWNDDLNILDMSDEMEMYIEQKVNGTISIDKQGAKQLIEVLQDWIGEDYETNI